MRKLKKLLLLISLAVFLLLLSPGNVDAQSNGQIVRLAKIRVDSLQIQQYNAALRIQMTTAVKLEPGVLTYYAVSDKKDPSTITILEIYKDSAAYNHHILTPHFLTYKQTVQHMVKSLQLVDVDLIGYARKPDM